MEKDGRIGVRRKPSKRRRTGSALAKAVANYLASDCYMYAPLVEPRPYLDSAPQVSDLSPPSSGGYDINYVLDSPSDARGLRKVASVKDGRSGRGMELWANQPGVQFYTANFLKDVTGKGGHVYQQHDALCLETQGFPDAVNHPNFPSQIVYPGHVYRHEMLFQFSVEVHGHAAAN